MSTPSADDAQAASPLSCADETPSAPNLTVALYRAAVGPVNAAHYLAAFERMDATGRTLSGWNWAAAVCTLGWLVFRQLWVAALAYVLALGLLGGLLAGLGPAGLALPAPVWMGLLLAAALSACVLPGLYGDVLVYRQVQQRIHQAVSAAPTMRDALARLERQASRPARLAWVAVGLCLAAALLAGAVLAWLTTGTLALKTGLGWNELQRQASQVVPPPQPALASSLVNNLPPERERGLLATHASALDSAGSAAGSLAPASFEKPVEPALPGNTSTSSVEAAGPSSLAPEEARPAGGAAVGNAGDAPLAAPGQRGSGQSVSRAAPPLFPSPSASEAEPKPKQGASAAAPEKPTKPGSPALARTASPVSSQWQSRPQPAAASAPPTPPRQLFVNAGLFSHAANAQRAHRQLARAGLASAVLPTQAPDGKRLHRVRVGPFASTAEANAAAARVKALGLEAGAAAQ